MPRFIKWLAPGITLVLIPKCPLCLAAYVAVGTGIGLSLPAATYLRIALLVICISSLCYLTVKTVKSRKFGERHDNGKVGRRRCSSI
jgi:hypothetical protein